MHKMCYATITRETSVLLGVGRTPGESLNAAYLGPWTVTDTDDGEAMTIPAQEIVTVRCGEEVWTSYRAGRGTHVYLGEDGIVHLMPADAECGA